MSTSAAVQGPETDNRSDLQSSSGDSNLRTTQLFTLRAPDPIVLARRVDTLRNALQVREARILELQCSFLPEEQEHIVVVRYEVPNTIAPQRGGLSHTAKPKPDRLGHRHRAKLAATGLLAASYY